MKVKNKKIYIHPFIKYVCIRHRFLAGSQHETDGSGEIETDETEEEEGGSRHSKESFFDIDFENGGW